MKIIIIIMFVINSYLIFYLSTISDLMPASLFNQSVWHPNNHLPLSDLQFSDLIADLMI